MKIKIEKIKINIKYKSIPIDSYFLNAVSMKHFSKPYAETKAETNKLVRELVKNVSVDDLHPQFIERHILADFFTEKLKKELNNIDIYPYIRYNVDS